MTQHPATCIAQESEVLLAIAALAYDHARCCMQLLAPVTDAVQLTTHEAQVHAQSLWLRWSSGIEVEEESRDSVCRELFIFFVATCWAERQMPRTQFAKSAFSVASGSRGEAMHMACLAIARSSAWLTQCYNESTTSYKQHSVIASDRESGRSAEQSLRREVLTFAMPQLFSGRQLQGLTFKMIPPVCVATIELSRDQQTFASSNCHDAIYGVVRAAFESAMLTLVSMYSSGSPIRVTPMLINAALHLAASAFEYMRHRILSTEVSHMRQLFVLIFVNSSLTRLTLRPGDVWQQQAELDKCTRLVFYCLCMANRKIGIVSNHLQQVSTAMIVSALCHTLALSPRSKPARCHRDAMLQNSPICSNWFAPMHIHSNLLARWYERTSDAALDNSLTSRPKCVVQPPPAMPQNWRWLPVRMQPDGAADLVCGVCQELLTPFGQAGVHSLQSPDLHLPQEQSCGMITCGSCAHSIRCNAGLDGAKCPYCRKLMSGAFKINLPREAIVTATFTPLPFALQKRVKQLIVECAHCKCREMASNLETHQCGVSVTSASQIHIKREVIDVDHEPTQETSFQQIQSHS